MSKWIGGIHICSSGGDRITSSFVRLNINYDNQSLSSLPLKYLMYNNQTEWEIVDT